MSPSPLNVFCVFLLALLLGPSSAEPLMGVGQLLAGANRNPSELGEDGLEELGGHKDQGNQGVRNLIEGAAHQGPLTKGDFVIVFSSVMGERMLLAHATRSWRQGIRTLIAINGSDEDAKKLTDKYSEEHNEFYVAAPDDGEGYWGRRHSHYAGDPRAAYAPVLAHRYFKGNYKWMLTGDDDTLFFPHAVKTLLKDYDHNTIHAISDRTERATCVPCFFDRNNPPTGDLRGLGPPLTKPLDASIQITNACPFCKSSMESPEWLAAGWSSSGLYGGAGLILSKAAMDHVTAEKDQWLNCIINSEGQGWDHLLSTCLWSAGVSFTNPGYAYAYGYNYYTVFKADWTQSDMESHFKTPLQTLVSDTCDYNCKWRIRNQ
eukprot:gene23135-30339_t